MIETLDETIEQVETLYESVTGRKVPPAETKPYAEIPPEKDADSYVGEQIEKLLASLAQVATRPLSVPSWSPPLWACYGADKMLIQLDLPGVTREALRVRIGNGVLQVSGSREFPSIEDARCSRYAEQRFGAFQRLIPIPPGIAADQVKAELKDGVLTVKVPKLGPPVVEGREITVS